MIINKVVLKNFKSHAHTEMNLNTGLSLMLGNNGAGKTSIFEAISFGLFKEFTGSIDRLVRSNANELSVEIEFMSDGRRYAVERKRKKQSNEAKLYLIKDNEYIRIGSGDTNVSEEIEKILHLDKQLFLNAIYVRQGEIAKLITETPTERKKIITKLLGIDALQRVWEKMPNIINKYELQKNKTEGEAIRFAETENDLKEREDRLKFIDSEISEITNEIIIAENEFTNYKQKKELFDEKEKQFIKLNGETKKSETELKEKRKQIIWLQNELDKIDESEQRVRDIEQLLSNINLLEKLRDHILNKEQFKREHEELKEENEKLNEKLNDNKLKLKERVRHYSLLLEIEISDLKTLEIETDKSRTETEMKIEEIEKNKNKLSSDVSLIKGQITEIKNLKRQVESSKDICPVCNAKLTSEHKNELLNKYDFRISEREKSIELLIQELEKTEKLYKVTSEKLRKTQEIGIELLKNIDSNSREIQNEIFTIDNKIAHIENNIHNEEKNINEILSVTKIDSDHVKEELKNLREKEAVYNQLKGLIGKKEEFNRQLNEYRQEAYALEHAMKNLETELYVLGYDQKQHEIAVQNLKISESKLNEIRNKKIIFNEQKRAVEERVRELKTEIESLKLKKLKLKRLEKFLLLLNKVRQLFDKDGLQKELRLKSKPLIEKYTREFFNEFNFEYSDIKLDDDYDITVYGPMGESSVEMLSGGEKIAVAIALRLGLAKALAGSVELIMLDEPTIHLDVQRRQELIDVFKKLMLIPQMLIVTHDEALEDAADSIYIIKKENGCSRVLTGGM